MSDSDHENPDDLVVVALAVRTRGLKGELVADLLTDFPERFEGLSQLIGLSPAGTRFEVKLENHWFQNDRIILKLSGCDDVEAAKNFVGYKFCVPEAEQMPLDDDEFYDWELEGCDVKLADGKSIGTVQSVMKTGGVEILVVTDGEKNEVLVPLVSSIVLEVDRKHKSILVDPPEGLLQL